jgi:hypothetical protein
MGERRPSTARRPRRRGVILVLGSVTLVLVVLLAADVGASRPLIRGLLYWSLVAAPIGLGIAFFGRFLIGAGGFLGGGSPYEGHGPEERHRR